MVNKQNEGNKFTQPRYVQITDQTARILLKILELESEEVTIPKLAKALSLKQKLVHDFIKECEQDSRQFLAFNEWSSTKGNSKKHTSAKKTDVSDEREEKEFSGGRHTDILEIRPDKLITNPLSAKILLILAKDSKESREVNKNLFMKHLLEVLDSVSSNYQDFPSELTARVNFLSKIGDICDGDETVPDIIWINWLRYHSQKAYLKLLSEEKLFKSL